MDAINWQIMCAYFLSMYNNIYIVNERFISFKTRSSQTMRIFCGATFKHSPPNKRLKLAHPVLFGVYVKNSVFPRK